MIQANELRIGNWVTLDGSVTHGTFQLSIKSFHRFKDNETDYAPIPLTPEILKKCGFVKNRANELSIEIGDFSTHLEMGFADGDFYPSITQTPQGSEERTVFFNRITSLHQLQNLYFALTGEELNYTP